MQGPTASARLTTLEAAIASVRLAHRRSLEDRIQAVQRARQSIEAFFADRAKEVRSKAERLLHRGVPPSLRHLCGTWDLEVPLNRILGWLFDPAAPHGAGAAPLLRLARALDLPAMASDLRNGAPARVLVESSPDPARWWRQPDLVVETPNAVLLLENKVLAPESGPEQYEDYLAMAMGMAEGRPWCAVLLARELREAPPGWTRAMRHAELADLLVPLCTAADLSAWGRVLVTLVVTDLRHDDLTARIEPIRRLLERAPGGDLRPLDVRRLSRLLEDIPEYDPWGLP